MDRQIDFMRHALLPHLPAGTRITGIAPLTTGFSNDTFLIEGCDLILRTPPSAGAMLDGHDVIAQANIYRTLGTVPAAPKVPGILMICEDRSVLGDPFFIMERIPGESISDVDMQGWFCEAADDSRRSIARQWISAFARLATLEPLAVLNGAVTPENDARRWQNFARRADCPRLTEYFDELLAIPAPLSGPAAIVHGDPKLSNIMWREGRITAVLDWEMALNGEPLADLGYMLYGVESQYHVATRPQKLTGMLRRDEVIELWTKVSGRSAEGVIWHEIAQIGKIAAIIAQGTNMFVTGRSHDPKLKHFKANLEYYLGVMGAMLDDSGLLALKG